MQRMINELPCSNSFRSFCRVSSFLCLLLCSSANCETYTVGDGDQWSTGVNYLTWSLKYTFRVDDVLVFRYIKGQHSVYQVTEETYRSCDERGGVLARYQSGNDQVRLTHASKHWFICGVPGHCLGGMRFGINVTFATAAANDTTGSTSPTSVPHKSCSSQRGMRVIYLLVVLLVTALVAFC